MKPTKLILLALSIMVIASGCLTSEEPFYQDSDVKIDDRLVGTYADDSDHSQSPTHFYVSKAADLEEHGRYSVTIGNVPGCSMNFGAVLFQIGTNRFLDMMPVIEACDHIPANPPSLIELLQSATLRPQHMVVRVDFATNGISFAFADHPNLLKAAASHPEYFQPIKPEQLPRMVGDSKKEREFLLRFGGDTNIFKSAILRREAK